MLPGRMKAEKKEISVWNIKVLKIFIKRLAVLFLILKLNRNEKTKTTSGV